MAVLVPGASAQVYDLSWLRRTPVGAEFPAAPSQLVPADRIVVEEVERSKRAAADGGRDEELLPDIIKKITPIVTRDKFGRIIQVVTDTRRMVSPQRNNNMPFSAIVRLQVRFANVDHVYQGTGFLVDSGLIVTAAHVINHPRYGYAELVAATPGCNLAQSQDISALQMVESDRLRTHPRWGRPNFAASHDYGAILLPDRKKFQHCGKFSLMALDDATLRRQIAIGYRKFAVSGYPTDKTRGTQQWRALGRLKSIERGFIRHLIDTTKGQSGSPLAAIILNGAQSQQLPIVFGVHSRGDTAAGHNVAARVDSKFRDWIALRLVELERLNRLR